MLNNGNNFQDNQPGVLYRHGDVLLKQIDSLPVGVQKRVGTTLAHGELTGHSHRIQQSHTVQLWVHGNDLFLEVKQPSAKLIHEEHQAIELPQRRWGTSTCLRSL
ncbi:hypothetical protein IQ257_03815 [Coleofasciculus sp. LEGE 07092]|nr:hypothetical protein [Coleofasciculus sp. LEGE 07081]MBE9147656.1 hypothetical protein [Coleofasciculus sp. LEGE 07092]